MEDVRGIKMLKVNGEALNHLYAVVIANREQCAWSDVIQLVHRMTNLEAIEITASLTGVFTVMLEDVLQWMSPSMKNLKFFCVSRHVQFGFMSPILFPLLQLSIPPSIEEVVLTDVTFRRQGRHESDTIVADRFARILTQLPNLKRLVIQRSKPWRENSSIIRADHLQTIFRYKSLQHLVLRNMALSDDDFEVVAEELTRNCTLESIDLGGRHRTRSMRGYDSILRAMEHQYYVKYFNMITEDESPSYGNVISLSDECVNMFDLEIRDRVQFGIDSFTKLNVADRKRILRDEKLTRNGLLQIVGLTIRDDVNAIFSILRSHPQILSVVETS
ncbi:hypothetical protein FisN_12Hh167 [Fistulifera solaris]|uniref:Uncharacterized protein n=1 Tax=Fistulifera solaris TaxID=1519565 RepID=A0A1Z5KBX3_FISSO|nr:hypothetical protein FisN_12Hh167 [Fistulifera solaris]|eukprot:GAX23601.1 hypothetical protein FisN_12Hh167 [Fistulifera solaris]